MKFQEFENKIVKITKLKLPGEVAQFKMAPMERLVALKKIAIEKETVRKAGVLVLFYPSEAKQTMLALILRKTYKGVHSAQIGFPGGKYENEDTSLKETALRETEEEIGVLRNTVSVLKKLTEVYIPPSNFFVQPYLGITKNTPNFILQEEEVETLIEVPLIHFMDDTIKIHQNLTTSYAKNIIVPAFLLNNYLVWGATAMMLNEVREMLKELL
jgi:8-oxo-dGTP pyrophosphatase MutT (NUDIX family)|tara:strand:+ start:290 stop:931 length:642 start_codon:yes stop_codon:yes gene_type:complete